MFKAPLRMAVLAGVLVATAAAASAHGSADQGMGWGPMMMSPGQMGGMAPGMMGGMGPGMMGGMGPGMMGYGMSPCLGAAPASSELSVDDAKSLLERWLAVQGNPRLKLGTVGEEGEDAIVADIVTQDGALVDRLRIDRRSGQMQRVP